MRGATLAIGALTACLTLFFASSLTWALGSREQITLDMTGNVTTLQLFEGDQIVSPEQAEQAALDLVGYLSRERLALAAASNGNGYPEMVILDYGQRLPWFPDVQSSEGSQGFLFAGTYSAAYWQSAGRTSPIIRTSLKVAGVIPAPTSAGDLQVARTPARGELLPAGSFVLSTDRPEQLEVVVNYLFDQGLAVQEADSDPLATYLAQDPVVVTSTALLLTSQLCAGIYWATAARARIDESRIRRQHGATTSRLVARASRSSFFLIAGGTLLGISSSVVLVTALSGREMQASDIPLAALCLALSCLLGVATLTLATAVARRNDLKDDYAA